MAHMKKRRDVKQIKTQSKPKAHLILLPHGSLCITVVHKVKTDHSQCTLTCSAKCLGIQTAHPQKDVIYMHLSSFSMSPFSERTISLNTTLEKYKIQRGSIVESTSETLHILPFFTMYVNI